jgi:hypothetical protein
VDGDVDKLALPVDNVATSPQEFTGMIASELSTGLCTRCSQRVHKLVHMQRVYRVLDAISRIARRPRDAPDLAPWHGERRPSRVVTA